MPFIEIKVIEGAFTHTVITETPSGEWAIGGQSLTAEDVRAKRAAPAHA